MQLIPLDKIHSLRDSLFKTRDSHLIDKAMTLEPNGLNRRIIVIHILPIILFEFCVVPHVRLSLLNNFYSDILHLYNIVIPTISSVTFIGFHVTSQYFPNMDVRHICAL